MPLENLTGSKFIDALVSSNPATGDSRTEGDDHIRGIKNVLLNSFPAITGAVKSTQTELNYNDIATLGTAQASKVLTADASGETTGAKFVSAILTTPQIHDSNKSHQYVYVVSDLTSDRNITLPLLLADDEFVFKDHAVILTNKTLVSAVLNTGVSGSAVDTDTALAADSDTLLASQKATKAYIDSNAGNTFISSGESYTGAGQALNAEAHGLAGTPQRVSAYAECTVIDNGFSVGDIIPLTSNEISGGARYGLHIWSDSTNVDGIVAVTGITYVNKGTGANVTLTAGRWNLHIIATYYI